jgi:antitoxin (DNA-binding transcriptional repressor) of toxin-antitoxin stability system
MNTLRVSATSARNQFFELLNQVALGAQVIIEKDKKEVAMLMPRITRTDWKGLKKSLVATHGIVSDYDEKDNPLRKKDSSNFLGMWDKE